MTRFIFLADTHIGTTPVVFYQQPSVPERMGELLRAIETWMADNGPIDFILHGGDMIHASSRENIQRAAELFDLSVPVYLCLGNHDLTEEEALGWWLQDAPAFFPGSSPEFVIEHDDARLYVIPNQWENTPYRWQSEQRPHFSPDQEAWMKRAASSGARDVAEIFVTHNPIREIPVAQTGHATSIHPVPEAFSAQAHSLIGMANSIQTALGAHSHITTHVEHDGVHHVTTSSFVESPFEFKLFEVGPAGIEMTTHTLSAAVEGWRYDFDKAYVQGRPCDRAFRVPS